VTLGQKAKLHFESKTVYYPPDERAGLISASLFKSLSLQHGYPVAQSGWFVGLSMPQ